MGEGEEVVGKLVFPGDILESRMEVKLVFAEVKSAHSNTYSE